ncbi:MAG TPA: hypothetical protein VFW25_11725 [Silvibacterium sp.]|nr:hypothetical protein [Silvibacterium sp.]
MGVTAPDAAASQAVVIGIGGVPIQVRSDSPEFLEMLERRYTGFIAPHVAPMVELDVDLVAPRAITDEDDIQVRFKAGHWLIERGDLRAELEPTLSRGRVEQSANPYSIDTVLRIIHSLVLARRGGLLVHAASCVRNGRAFLFAGVSEAGKTTISSLAPPDATLLTDEISYLQRGENGFIAFGTPFAGELARPGENIQAPLGAIYLLQKGLENVIEPVRESDAVRLLMENVLFFANDSELVDKVFESVCKLVRRVPVRRLTFFPDSRVWDLIV